MELIITTFISALLLAGGYTFYIQKKKPSELWNWGHSAISMLASTMLALSVALVVFFIQQKESDADNRQRQLEVVKLELAHLRANLLHAEGAKISSEDKEFVIQIFPYQPFALVQAAQSGLFTPKQSWLLNDVVQSINGWNYKMSVATAAIGAPSTDTHKVTRLAWVSENIRQSRMGLLSGMDELAKELQIEIPTNVITR